MAYLKYIATCQWCGKQGHATQSAMQAPPTSSPTVPGRCTSHPSGKTDANHGPRWVAIPVGENEQHSKWVAVCQWCGREGNSTASRMSSPPTSSPIIPGRCTSHPSGDSNANHGPRWERR